MGEKKVNKHREKTRNEEFATELTDAGQMSRRTFMKVAGASVGAVALGVGLSKLEFLEPPERVQALKPVKLAKYIVALPIPPVALAGVNANYPGADYYELPIGQATHQFHTALPSAPTYGYGGASYLGPTIVATRNKEVVIKFTNNLPLGNHLLHSAIDTTIMGSLNGPNADGTRWADENRVAVHLHGGKTKVEFDGGPRDWFSPVGSGQANPYPDAAYVDPGLTGSYTYRFSNDQAATLLWYHDHAWAITRFNPFAGLAAAYILRDAGENGLISGGAIPSGAYEVPIVLQDRLLDTTTGAMIYPITNTPGTHPIWIPEYFGDTPVVNGKAYPFLNVEPRRYRFRFLNGSNARFYNIWFNDPLALLWVIGSEQGFLPAPKMVNRLVIGPGERFDTIFDFTGMPNGTILTLRNNAKAPYPGGRGGDIPEIMQFRVVLPLTGTDTTTLPGSLTLPTIATPLTQPAKPWREIVLSEIPDPVTGQPLEALLDGLHLTDTIEPNNPLFTEQVDSTNIWQFINTTGDAHPMHPHLVPFQILNRQRIDTKGFLAAWNAWIAGGRVGIRPTVDNFLVGAAYGPAPEETGWKDTAKAYPGEVLRTIAKFELAAGLPSGVYRYVCHCHILEHEENDMMFYWAVQK